LKHNRGPGPAEIIDYVKYEDKMVGPAAGPVP